MDECLDESAELKAMGAGERLVAIAALYDLPGNQIPVDVPPELEDKLAPFRRFLKDHRVVWNDLAGLGNKILKNFSITDLRDVHAQLSAICTNARWDGQSQSPIEGYTMLSASQCVISICDELSAASVIENIEFLKNRNQFIHDAIFRAASSIADHLQIEVATITHGGFTVDLRSVKTREQMIRAVPLLLCGAQSTLSGTIIDGLNTCALRNGYRDNEEMASALQRRFNIARSEWASACIITLIDAAEQDEITSQFLLLMRLIRRLTIQKMTQGTE